MSLTKVIVWILLLLLIVWFVRNRWKAWRESRKPLRSTYTAMQMEDNGKGTGAVVNKKEVVAYSTNEAREIAEKELGPLPEGHNIVIRETFDFDMYEKFD